MVLAELVSAVISWVWVGIQLGVIFTLCTIPTIFLFNFFQKKYGWKWLGAALATMITAITLVFFLFHTMNIFAGFGATDITLVPPTIRDTPEFQADQPNLFFTVGAALIQSLFSGIIFAILILPFAFAGVAVFDGLKKRIKGVWSRIFITCFLAALVFILVLGVFPWILVSLIYLAFFGL